VPAEIARHGLPLNISLLTASRFGLDFRNADFQVGGIDVPVMLLDAAEQTILPITAYPTHEGWYRIAVPVPRGGITTAVQIGRLWSAVQLGDATWTPAAELDNDADALRPGTIREATRTPATILHDAMRRVCDDIHACDESGVIVAMPPARDTQVLTLLFRPLTARTAAAEQKVAA